MKKKPDEYWEHILCSVGTKINEYGFPTALVRAWADYWEFILTGPQLSAMPTFRALVQMVALTSVDRVSHLCALSVSPQCLMLSANTAVLYSNPAFMPKVITSAFSSRRVI